MSNSIIVQQSAIPAAQLVLLMHGVGSLPESMLGVARWFAAHDSAAFVVSVASPDPSDISGGLQWFSVRDVTEADRQARVDAAMPGFLACVRHWQQVAGVQAQHTLIAGFSQGAIMALESIKLAQPPALRVVSFAGRFATLPEHKPEAEVHLLHGAADPVMPVAVATAAAQRLSELGASATLDIEPRARHELHPALLGALAARLASSAHARQATPMR